MASTISTKRKRKQRLDWAGLPYDLVELVIKKLPLVDCLSFGSVCKSWRSVTMNLFEGSSRGIPLLVKPDQSEKRLTTCLNVLDKKTKRKKCSTFDIPMPEGSHIWGSYHDWLILGRLNIDDDKNRFVKITLLNPFSGKKVVLPKTRDGCQMVVLSSVPSDPRCIYMLVGIVHNVAFWTSSSGQEDWVRCKFQESGSVSDALYHDRHFYLLYDNYELVVIDEISIIDTMLHHFDYRRGLIEIATRCLEVKKAPFSGEPSSSGDLISKNYIVESSGDILLVSRVLYNHSPKWYQTCAIETFRLDVSGMAWIKLESLKNNRTIILGRSSSRSFDAKEELGDDALANNIYFSNYYVNLRLNEWGNAREAMKYIKLGKGGDAVVDDWGVFRLEEGHNKTTENSRSEINNNWPRAFDAHPKHWAGIWVTAPIWWCLKQHHEHQTLKRATRAPRRTIRR